MSVDEEAEAGESRGWCWKRCECDIGLVVVVVVDNASGVGNVLARYAEAGIQKSRFIQKARSG